ncbi:hypothetical protein V8C44DRAFT_338383 [Trichoderma aethiopicum]
MIPPSLGFLSHHHSHQPHSVNNYKNQPPTFSLTFLTTSQWIPAAALPASALPATVTSASARPADPSTVTSSKGPTSRSILDMMLYWNGGPDGPGYAGTMYHGTDGPLSTRM